MFNLNPTLLRSALISSVFAGIVIAPLVELSLIAPASAELSQWVSLWQRRPPRPLGTRSGVCLMTPGLLEKDLRIVSDRPLFSWQGKATKLNVRDYTTQKIVWTIDLDPQAQQIAYGDVNPLEPGKLYEWQVLGEKPSSTDLGYWTTVEIMAAPERDQVNAKLKKIEQAAQKSKVSPESTVNQQVAYLLEQNLWSDAMTILYTVKNPSSEFAQKRQQLASSLCTAKTTSMKQAR
ncbi:hypothetical protein [Leptolyngbya sp. GGD]|uniref:hypothetical protein n=1 Tax=Leptolyngbya sp. GGD TaxID=2997907 RepID=UPI00227CACD8|nr:hypothetical protein [Leptolyngbya sp. GGD]MCY6493869.1 hypothetical protein [Leptolyngbya sp. GGD]